VSSSSSSASYWSTKSLSNLDGDVFATEVVFFTSAFLISAVAVAFATGVSDSLIWAEVVVFLAGPAFLISAAVEAFLAGASVTSAAAVAFFAGASITSAVAVEFFTGASCSFYSALDSIFLDLEDLRLTFFLGTSALLSYSFFFVIS
jgi:hypothetical protein